MARAVGPINYPAIDVMRCMMYGPLRREWDVNNDFMEHKKKIGVNAYVTDIKTAKKFVISARDFVVNYVIHEEADGTIMICTSSDNCPLKMPDQSGCVRGYTALTGYVFKPDPSDPKNKCFMHMTTEVDLKGAIPEFAMRTVMKDQGYQIVKIRSVMPKWKAIHPGVRPPNEKK